MPVGAWLFREYIDPRALVFAVVAFGGVALVLFSAPPNGDASLEGNVFGFLAMLLLVAYVASTRHFRQDMDVTTFMATICPIAAVAVLPLALAHGDVFGMSGTGWTYMLILTFTSGVAAQGLLVFAQKTIQIGTIGIAQVAQPALAVVWSFLLLGEVVNHAADRRHRHRHGRAAGIRRAEPAWHRVRRPVALRDEVRGGLHAPVGRLGSRSRAVGVAGLGGDAGERVEREDLDGGVVLAARVVEDRDEPLARRRRRRPAASSAASRHSPSAACSPPPASRCHAAAASSAARAGAGLSERAQHAPEMHPASAARRTSPVASAFSIASSSVAAPVS